MTRDDARWIAANIVKLPELLREAVIGSVELIAQPAAKDPVGEMGVRGDLPSTRSNRRAGGEICIVKVAKVHVIRLNSPSPVSQSQPALRAVAQRPTGVDVGMTDRVANRERSAQSVADTCCYVTYATADCLRSL